MNSELYAPVPLHNESLNSCPLCGSPAELWQFSKDGVVATKVVMCSNGDPVADIESGCPLFIPPDEFYTATKREAAGKWNEFGRTVSAMRAKHLAAQESL